MPDLDHFASRAWNAGSEVAKHKWLTNEPPVNFQDRMRTLGNVVVPAQAFLAVTSFAKTFAGEFRD